MYYLIGVAIIFAVILMSLLFTLFELMDRLNIARYESKKAEIHSLFKYWPISIWVICWNGSWTVMGLNNRFEKRKKGGQIEE